MTVELGKAERGGSEAVPRDISANGRIAALYQEAVGAQSRLAISRADVIPLRSIGASRQRGRRRRGTWREKGRCRGRRAVGCCHCPQYHGRAVSKFYGWLCPAIDMQVSISRTIYEVKICQEVCHFNK
jgi:hypothetical protein